MSAMATALVKNERERKECRERATRARNLLISISSVGSDRELAALDPTDLWRALSELTSATARMVELLEERKRLVAEQ